MANLRVTRDASSAVGRQAADAAHEAAPWIVRLARVGYAAKGTVYLVIGGLALAAARRPRHLPLVALVPLALFSRGPRAALRSRDWVHLAAPFIQLAQEAASDVGFVRGYVQMRGEFARP